MSWAHQCHNKLQLISTLLHALKTNYFADKETTKTMQQPLLSEHDASFRQSVLTSCKNEKRTRRRRTMIVKVFLIGIAAGLVLQALTFSAFVTILKFWGRDPRPQDLSNRAMYFVLFLLSQADIAVYSVIIVMFIFFLTKSGPRYMRKKFDCEDGTIRTKEGESTTSSLSTRKFLFRAGITFLFGIMLGSAAPLVAVDYKMGMPMTLGPLVATLLLDLFLLPIMFRSFDWAQEEDDDTSSDEEEQREAIQSA
jgi:hypothetical protein